MPDAIKLENGKLSQADKDFYWDNGYLFPMPVLSEEKARHYRNTLEDMESEWLDNGLPLPLNTYKRVNAHCVMPFAAEIAREPAVLDVVEGVLGPDILVWGVEFFIKEPNTTHIVSMHQDLTYWGLGEIDGLVTAWIALSPATPESGCMDFVAKSHKNPILEHNDTFDKNNLLSRGQEIAVEVKEEDKVPIEIHPGQMSLHHGLIIHGSGPNTSDDRRIAAVVRYIRPDMAQQVADKDYVIMGRGADRHGNFVHFAPPDTMFSKESLELYEEIRVAQAQALMKGAEKQGELYKKAS